jgi:medium-chain acyl-[acyl-carrier-protein] hydrolase
MRPTQATLAGGATNPATGERPRCTPWRRLNPNAVVRLFCLPYAGGASTIFRPWVARLSPEVDVCPIEMPGHGTRFREPLLDELPMLVRSLVDALCAEFREPFALFGHSMGALVAFELARLVRATMDTLPVHIFVSGAHAPQAHRRLGSTTDLDDASLMRRLRRYGGTPAEVLNAADLMHLFLPVVRADFRMLERYVFAAGEPLACPITAFGGMNDDLVGVDALNGWAVHTTCTFERIVVPGSHFFIHDAHSPLPSALSRTLLLGARHS